MMYILRQRPPERQIHIFPMKNQYFHPVQRHRRDDPERQGSENGGSRSRGVAKMHFEDVNKAELSLFPLEKSGDDNKPDLPAIALP